jgi:hypothetical protein
MFIDNLMNKFGYSEMYEWSELFKFDIVPYGRFVAFDNNEPGKIRLGHVSDYIIGVTTINTVCTSDNPEEWQGKYLCNEYGDCLLQEKDKATAINAYDDVEEFPYIATIKEKEIVPVINDEYDSSKEYKKRTDRLEWIRVNLIGKCIVVDNGECQPGKFCTVGENGIAKPTDISRGMPYVNKWHVIDRLTDNTIMIFFK